MFARKEKRVSDEQIKSDETSVEVAKAGASSIAVLRHSPEARPGVLDCLMGVADHYRTEGALRQATEIYFELVDNYEDTPQATQACGRLLKIASHYERTGARRQARDIYERLV